MRAALLRIAERTESDRKIGYAILLFILLVAGCISTLNSIARHFWFDEMCTLIVCRTGGLHQIWGALAHAADTNPPVFYLVEKFSRWLVGEDHLGYRLPSIVGMLCTVACIYFVLRRRVGTLAALTGASLILSSSIVAFSDDARPYALMMGFLSLTILAWQHIDRSRLCVLLFAIALAAAGSLHYYAILALPAFCAAEATVWIAHRRFRLSVWIALVAGVVPLFVCRNLLHDLHDYYGQHFWANSQTNILRAFSAYNWLFSFSGSAVSSVGLLFIASITAIFLAVSFGDRAPSDNAGRSPGGLIAIPAEEKILALMLLWGLPLLAEIGGKLSHGGMYVRYMQPTILGAAIMLGLISEKLPVLGRALVFLLLLANYVLSQGAGLAGALHGPLKAERTASAHDAATLTALGNGYGLPIVISDAQQYLPMAYYASNDSRDVLLTVVDPQRALQLTKAKSDSVDLAMLSLKEFFPLHVEDYDHFVAGHRQFLLVLGEGPGDWWPARIAQGGYALELVSLNSETTEYNSAGAGSTVYKVTVVP